MGISEKAAVDYIPSIQLKPIVSDGVIKNPENPVEIQNKSFFYYWTPNLILTTFLVWIGCSLPTGYNLGVINTPQQLIKDFVNGSLLSRFPDEATLSVTKLDLLWSIIVSSFLLGGCIGALLVGWISSSYGRKPTIYLTLIFQVIGSIIFSISKPLMLYELLILARFFTGLSAGLSYAIVSLYLTELGPIQLRGCLGVVQLLGLTIGIVISQVLGLDFVLGNDSLWPVLLSVSGTLPCITLAFFRFSQESPKFLYIVKGQQNAAIEAMKKLRRTKKEVEEEMKEMTEEIKAQSSQTWTPLMILSDKSYRKMLFLVCLINLSQQLSGINAVFLYSSIMLNNVGLDASDTQYINIGIGVCNAVMSMVSVLLCQKFRRRPLLLTSYLSTSMCLTGITISSILLYHGPIMRYIVILLLMLYIVCFNIGIAPIPFFIGSELFPPGPKAIAMSFGAACNWGGNFIVGITFPSMLNYITHYSFLVFASILIVTKIIVYFLLPETKDKEAIDILKEGNKS